MTDSVIRKKYTELDSVVEKVGRERVVLCHCDGPQAIRFGRGLGISLFQGYYVANMIEAQASRGNPRRKSAPRQAARRSTTGAAGR